MVAINYDPTADFGGFVSEAFGSYVSPEDISVLQRPWPCSKHSLELR